MLTNPGRVNFNTWRGLNTFEEKEAIDPQTWWASNNVLVNAKGQAEVMRSPKSFGDPVNVFDDSDSSSSLSDSSSGSGSSSSESSSGPEPTNMHGLDEYKRLAGHVLVVDKGEDTLAFTSAGGAPTQVRSDGFGDPWVSLTINDRFHRIDGHEFIQIMPNLAVFRNGIDPPTDAPVISYDTDSSESESETVDIVTSMQGSYAYRNSSTGHVSAPSPLSNVLEPASGGNAISWTVTASAQPGVDQIVFFLTVDGGNIPYLVIDCDSLELYTVSNSTGTVVVDLVDIDRDALTPEPLYNHPPLTSGAYMFAHKNRIFQILADGTVRYSGYESCYIGRQEESWPVLNSLKPKNDRAIGGISTGAGALLFGESDSHLLSGSPSDKTSSPNNATAITEKLDPMNWGIGIGYAETAVTTPYGTIWTDQNKRVRNWNMTGFPIEIAVPLRTELDNMTGPLRAKWFQHGKNGGYYVLTNGTTTLFIMLYLSSQTGQLAFGYGKTDLTMDAISQCTFNGVERFFYGVDDQVYEILDPTQEGDGWEVGTQIFFKIMLGNSGNISYFHSMQIEGGMKGLKVIAAASGETKTLVLESAHNTDGARNGLIDLEGKRCSIEFRFNTDDTEYRNIDGFQSFQKNKRQLL